MTLRRMLAVSHEATITGAPMNLLHLLRWIAANTDVELHTVVAVDGPLRHGFEQVGPVTVLDRSPSTSALALAQRGLTSMGSRRARKAVAQLRLKPQLRHLVDFDLVYLNSLTSISLLPYLPSVGSVVSHAHELQVATRTFGPSTDRELFLQRPDRWIAASDAVRKMLVDELELPGDQVLLHHEFIDIGRITRRSSSLRQVERTRREQRIPSNAAVVMGAGTIDWRKGPDLFIQLATEVRRRTREPVHFVWVGGELRGTDWERLRSDLERSGADHVHFVGTKPDPLPWFAIADVFALTSREDPYPLVCLEHAAMGHPIVTYRNGGITELLEAAGPEAAEGIADHLDVGGLADRVIALLSDDRLARTAGNQLRAHVQHHHDVEVAAPGLVDDLRAVCCNPVCGTARDGAPPSGDVRRPA